MHIPRAPYKRYILSFDGETDGLYGDCWAIGGLVIDRVTNEVVDQIKLFLLDTIVMDEWVNENIFPLVNNDNSFKRVCTEGFSSDFLYFISRWKNDAFCVVDFGCPVETTVMANVIRQFIPKESWLSAGPYPMHELGSMLHMANIDPDINRIELCRHIGFTEELTQHNPYDDAKTTVIIADYLLSQMEAK